MLFCSSGKKKKAPRTWDGQPLTGEAAKALDYGNSEEVSDADAKKLAEQWVSIAFAAEFQKPTDIGCAKRSIGARSAN